MAQLDYFVHKTAIVDDGAIIGQGTRIWHFSHIMSHAELGENCIIGQNVFVGKSVKLGDLVKVQNNVSIYEGVECEREVFLGPSCVFTNVINPRAFIERKTEFRKTIIRRGASIGANATIICGNNIGNYAMVGAGSVVTKEVKDFSLVVGNPARHMYWVSVHGHQLEFDKSGIAICPISQWVYRLCEGEVKLIKLCTK